MPRRRITISSGFENNYLIDDCKKNANLFCTVLLYRYFLKKFFGQIRRLDYFFIDVIIFMIFYDLYYLFLTNISNNNFYDFLTSENLLNIFVQ